MQGPATSGLGVTAAELPRLADGFVGDEVLLLKCVKDTLCAVESPGLEGGNRSLYWHRSSLS